MSTNDLSMGVDETPSSELLGEVSSLQPTSNQSASSGTMSANPIVRIVIVFLVLLVVYAISTQYLVPPVTDSTLLIQAEPTTDSASDSATAIDSAAVQSASSAETAAATPATESPSNPIQFGLISLLPTLITLALAIYSRRPLESIAVGIVSGIILVNGSNVITPLADQLLKSSMDETVVWIMLVCGLMGGLINLLERGGSVLSFSGFMLNWVKSRRQSMLWTVLLGVLIFIDDYLNALAVSSSMKNLTDKYQISREKLAYLVDSTAAPICILFPVSTWAVYFAELLEENHAAEAGKGMALYMQSIPYMAYGFIALLLVFLVAMQVLPDFGPMKQAEARAKAGQPIPDNAPVSPFQLDNPVKQSPMVGLLNFLLPMVVLISASVYFEIDLFKGVIVAVFFTMALYYVQKMMSLSMMVDSLMDGFRTMLYPVAMVAAGFALKDINDQLGMTQYIIEVISPYVSAATLPALVFFSMAFVVFSTGSSWGVFVISIPIVLPVAVSIDAHMPLVIGALISASAFGSHACFFSDSTVLSAQGAGCSLTEHAFTQIPYALLGGALSIVTFLVLGYQFSG